MIFWIFVLDSVTYSWRVPMIKNYRLLHALLVGKPAKSAVYQILVLPTVCPMSSSSWWLLMWFLKEKTYETHKRKRKNTELRTAASVHSTILASNSNSDHAVFPTHYLVCGGLSQLLHWPPLTDFGGVLSILTHSRQCTYQWKHDGKTNKEM